MIQTIYSWKFCVKLQASTVLFVKCAHLIWPRLVGIYSTVDAQLQLAYLVLIFTSLISYLHAPFAWLPFPLHPTFILPLPAVCTGGNSISPLVHNRLSACNSTPTSTWAWSLLQAGAGWIPQALPPEKLTGAMGREGKPEQTRKGSPPYLCYIIYKEKENPLNLNNQTML